MALRSFYNEIKRIRVRDLPSDDSHLMQTLSPEYMKKAFDRAVDTYIDKYIETGSVQPLFHAIFLIMSFGYLVNLPEMLRHQEQQQQH